MNLSMAKTQGRLTRGDKRCDHPGPLAVLNRPCQNDCRQIICPVAQKHLRKCICCLVP
ncbi:unnamed protein product, partial [Brassica rapa subsp. narinosa]